jgi:hypothetical protein
MFRKTISILLLLAALTTAAFAQEGERMANPIRRALHPVESVELVPTDDGLELVIRGELPDGCDYPTVINAEPVGVTWFIDLYRELPFDVMCPAIIKPYEDRLDASFLLETTEGEAPGTQVIVINGEIYGIEPTGDEAAPLTLSETWVRSDLPYTNITTRHTPEGSMEITLTGVLTDGCRIPVYRAYEDWQNPGFVVVEAYTVLNIAASCLQAEVPFEVVMLAPVFESVAINGVSVPFNPAISADIQKFEKQALAIESATAEWVEGVMPNIKVTVAGIVDGCEDPIQLVQQPPVDNTFVVEVVRVVREGQACTMIAREFTQEIHIAPNMEIDGPITIYINGIEVTVEQD